MTTLNYPKKTAYELAKKLRKFRKDSETIITSEVNVSANEDMQDVTRQIDWQAFNDIVKALEFCYVSDMKHKFMAS